MKKRIEIPLGENKIVAEIYDMDCPEFPPEITIYLRDKDDVIIQDICLVRPHYVVDKETCETTISNDVVQCLVWGEPEIEDYTHKYIIGVHEWED